MTDEVIQNATPAAPETAEQVQSVESNSTEATTEQTQEQQQEQTQETAEEKAKKEPWFQKRIGELTREKYEAKRAADEARQQAEQYRTYLAQIQQGQQPQQHQPEVDVRTLAQQEAARMVAEQRFNESCNKVHAEGVKEFPDFDASNRNLQMLGASREFYELATSADAGHKLLHHLGQEQNLDEAERILRLPPVQMARELTKLEYKLSQPPAPKPVSKAPEPIKPIGAGGIAPNGLSDELPIDEWMRRHNKR
jgi:pyruvate/2-oxoglutarate dehydrogenase complex dihydrolipoamide acyltransferase (E2) component